MLRNELRDSIAAWNPALDGIADDTPLITTALLDSLNLVRLLLWIEEQLGRPVDATKIDIGVDWNTVAAVVLFIEREQATR